MRGREYEDMGCPAGMGEIVAGLLARSAMREVHIQRGVKDATSIIYSDDSVPVSNNSFAVPQIPLTHQTDPSVKSPSFAPKASYQHSSINPNQYDTKGVRIRTFLPWAGRIVSCPGEFVRFFGGVSGIVLRCEKHEWI